MKEQKVVERTQGRPATVQSQSTDLTALGVTPGMVLLVHSSLSSLGWVCVGPVAVILALEDALGPNPQGTLVMPTHTGDLSDPADWQNPPVPEAWWDTIRKTMPPYDPDLTPTRGVGVIPETFRKQKGALRSDHPQYSFAAWGEKAAQIVEDHSLNFGLGEKSPLARIYDLEGWVLLLGVGHESNTSIHLAEYRASYAKRRVVESGAPITVDGRREWATIQDVNIDESDFEAIGDSFERATEYVRRGKVAGAEARLMPQRALVDYAVKWIEQNR
ncbi:MAG: AAC(3) family N-acetyltransferase [Chloroflexi bacterium]|nr:AAC(3) family N-acetyltransferase [Chloroflexota bacterium]